MNKIINQLYPLFKKYPTRLTKSSELQALLNRLRPMTCDNINTSKKIGSIEMPSVVEMTFLRKDRANGLSYASTFPHPLDSDNSEKKPMVLPDCWHKPIY